MKGVVVVVVEGEQDYRSRETPVTVNVTLTSPHTLSRYGWVRGPHPIPRPFKTAERVGGFPYLCFLLTYPSPTAPSSQSKRRSGLH